MTRYMRRGSVAIRFAPTVAVKSAPTTAEVTAGTDITPQFAEVTGFEFSNTPIPTPEMVSTFTPQIGGEDTAGDSTITFYEDNTTNPIRTALAKGITGYLLFYPYTASPIATSKLEVWPIVVTSSHRQWSVGNDPARYVVAFAITSVPNLDAVQAA